MKNMYTILEIIGQIGNGHPYVLQYDDCAYELEILEFEDEKKDFSPLPNGNGDDNEGCGCALIVLIIVIGITIYLLNR